MRRKQTLRSSKKLKDLSQSWRTATYFLFIRVDFGKWKDFDPNQLVFPSEYNNQIQNFKECKYWVRADETHKKTFDSVQIMNWWTKIPWFEDFVGVFEKLIGYNWEKMINGI